MTRALTELNNLTTDITLTRLREAHPEALAKNISLTEPQMRRRRVYIYMYGRRHNYIQETQS